MVNENVNFNVTMTKNQNLCCVYLYMNCQQMNVIIYNYVLTAVFFFFRGGRIDGASAGDNFVEKEFGSDN